MTDLKLVLIHLGWTGCHEANGTIMGYSPGCPTLGRGASLLCKAPRYDQDVNLMIEVCGGLHLRSDKPNWDTDYVIALKHILDIERGLSSLEEDFILIQATAAQRLRAYVLTKGLT